MPEPITVMMVDDEPRFRDTTSKLLNKKGFKTTIAASGEAALELLRQTPCDVVVLDVKMEGMDGHTALAEIKKIAPDTQVIMLTGHGTPDSALRSLEHAAFDYLTKPCNIDLLAMKINEAYAVRNSSVKRGEKKAKHIMIGIEDYTAVTVDATIRTAIEKLMDSFKSLVSSSRIMETGHRSLLVFDHDRKLVGVLSIMDLIKNVRPAYLSARRPDMSESIRFSSMFWGGWDGLFSIQMQSIATTRVGDLMSEPPPTIDGETNLIEVADIMFKTQRRRLLVTDGNKVIGIIREQDLFFEMAGIVLKQPTIADAAAGIE